MTKPKTPITHYTSFNPLTLTTGSQWFHRSRRILRLHAFTCKELQTLLDGEFHKHGGREAKRRY